MWGLFRPRPQGPPGSHPEDQGRHGQVRGVRRRGGGPRRRGVSRPRRGRGRRRRRGRERKQRHPVVRLLVLPLSGATPHSPSVVLFDNLGSVLENYSIRIYEVPRREAPTTSHVTVPRPLSLSKSQCVLYEGKWYIHLRVVLQGQFTQEGCRPLPKVQSASFVVTFCPINNV